jgi:hypothetical protein
MITPKITVDTSAFDKAFKDYTQFNKRAMSEIVNTKAYYIARNAVNLTDSVDKSKIKSDLEGPSRVNPKVPLVNILINAQRGGQGLKGLQGAEMRSEANKLKKIKQNSSNFLRAGWIAAINAIGKFMPKKGGPSYKKVKIKGQEKGGGKGAPKENAWRTSASIWNTVTGYINNHGLNKHNEPSKVAAILEKGLQKAIDKETASMQAYVTKKLQEGIDKFNRA